MIKVGNYTIEESVYNILLKVKRELTNGKLSKIEKKAGQVVISCPYHSESIPSCYVNEDGIWHCFSCQESGKLPKLIGECFDADEKYGKQWLVSNYVGDVLVEHKENLFDDNLFEDKKEEFLDESILDKYEDWHPYLDKRHLDKDICRLFKVKYDAEKEMIVFPVWDEHNRLYMLTRRSVNDKTFHIDYNKEKPVYLLNYIIKKGIPEVTVCESQINALTCYGFGYPAIAMFGTGTDYQYKILNKSGIRFYHLAFDGDDAGRKATKKFIDNITNAFIDVIMIPEHKDVNDLTQEEFDNLEVLSSSDWLEKYCKNKK